MKAPASIIQVLAPARFGGAETVVLALARALRDRGTAVTVLASAPDDPEHPFLAGLRRANIQMVRSGPGITAQLGAIRHLLAQQPAPVLHAHGYRSDLLTLLAGYHRCPMISTVHGFTGGGFRMRLYERLQLRALRRFDRVIAVSQPLKDLLTSSGVRPARLRVIPNPLPPAPLLSRAEARARLGLPPTGLVVGWVGRLSREKGPDLGLKALARVSPADWSAAFIGSGPEEAALRRQAEALGIAARIRWLGVHPEAGSLMPGFDVLLSSSRTEGTPMVVLEALAAGTPVVAFAVGGIPDLMGPAPGAGCLVPPGQPEALAEALGKVLSGLRAGPTRRPEGTGDDLDRWVDRYLEIYREVSPPLRR